MLRSFLFAPGDSVRKLEKSLTVAADAVIADLEDSIAPDGKETARRVTADFLRAARGAANRPRLFVRINGLATGLADADLDAIMAGAPDGIVLPKAVGAADIQHLGSKLAVREAQFDLTDGATVIVALTTETARGLFALGTLPGASPRLKGVAWGGEDLSVEVGASANRLEDGTYTDPYRLARSLTLFGAAAAGVDAIDSVYTNFRNEAGLAAECAAGRRDGFVAKLAIHPAQVPVINEAFTPSAEMIAHAKAVVAAFAEVPGAGVVGLGGEMLDRPHLARAERVLARSGGD
jgi:citrate lyase subunit beta / citryl-CoA lyase